MLVHDDGELIVNDRHGPGTECELGQFESSFLLYDWFLCLLSHGQRRGKRSHGLRSRENNSDTTTGNARLFVNLGNRVRLVGGRREKRKDLLGFCLPLQRGGHLHRVSQSE